MGEARRLPSSLPGISAFVLLIFFSGFVAWIYSAVLDSGQTQRDIRISQAARASVLRLQLDQETGLRGFTSTGLKEFLEPYRAAASKIGAAFVVERDTLRAVKGSKELDSLVDQQFDIHERWIALVAEPLISGSPQADVMVLQAEGKKLIDRFRAVNAQIENELLAKSATADEKLWADLRRIIGLGLVGATALLVFSVFLTQYSGRAQREIDEHRIRYENEKRIADRLQEAFLQRDLPRVDNIALDAVYMPAEEQANIGGDWYDAFLMPDGRILFSIGDVCGHGVEAAVVMGRARQALLAAALQNGEPAAVLALANTALILQGGTMVTAICGFIDRRSLRIDYATAGHPPPILAATNEPATFLQHDGLPLGVIPTARYHSFAAIATEGSLLVLYTDGLLEYTRNIRRGETRLLDAVGHIARAAGPKDAANLRDMIFADAFATDDVAILTLRFTAAGNASLPAATEQLRSAGGPPSPPAARLLEGVS